MIYDEFRAMNTSILVAAEGSREHLQAHFTFLRRFVAECEEHFSRFRAQSELNQLNRSAGAWFTASPELLDVVRQAYELHQLTGGLFDPSVLRALQTAGYDRSMDEIRDADLALAPPAGYEGPWQRPPFEATRFDASARGIWLPAGVQIDLGGIAKGWIAARAAAYLARFTPACAVSAGGDMVLSGLPLDQPAWQVSLEDPRDPRQVLAVLNLPPGALATSAVTRRRWTQGGQPRHHIIDPRSGHPAEPAWLSVSVFTEKATHAEAFAKALLIGGPQQASRMPGLRFIAVRPDGSLWGTENSKEIYHVPEQIR